MSQRDPHNASRRFYGTVTVSERGQVVIPAEARRDLGIAVGDKLLVFGDLEFGLAFGRAEDVLSRMPGLARILGVDTTGPTDE